MNAPPQMIEPHLPPPLPTAHCILLERQAPGLGGDGTAETEAEGRLVASAGRANVLRQHMGSLQHNKTIAVNGPNVKKVVCGSTNLT
jgi:hypothetical protein